jgi:2-methylcitrate dehydratase PrpD
MTIAREWAAYCRTTASVALPPNVEARARLCLADHLHAAMHGARSDTGAMLRRYFGWEGSSSAAASAAASAESSALYAGAISAVHEIDDVHQDTSLHPGSVVVAAAIAVAGETDIPWSRLFAAIVAGYEVAVRLSVASGHRHYHYFHSTATCGTVGAAAAASIILGLDDEQTAHAIGMAVTTASGLWEGINDEAVTIKHLHPGLAAERGVRASKLARLGPPLRAAFDRGRQGVPRGIGAPRRASAKRIAHTRRHRFDSRRASGRAASDPAQHFQALSVLSRVLRAARRASPSPRDKFAQHRGHHRRPGRDFAAHRVDGQAAGSP